MQARRISRTVKSFVVILDRFLQFLAAGWCPTISAPTWACIFTRVEFIFGQRAGLAQNALGNERSFLHHAPGQRKIRLVTSSAVNPSARAITSE